jgi:aspartyl protease family protein
MKTRRLDARPIAIAAVLSALVWVLPAWTMPARAEAGDLRAQVIELAAQEGFLVSGLDLIEEDAPPRALRATGLARRISALLNDYNYLLQHDDEGGVRELWILEAKPAAASVAGRNAIGTTRRGRHHLVETALTGPNGQHRTMALTLDTGATMILLPHEMIALLGFRDRDLRDGWSRTVGGRVPVKLGRLKTVRVGHALAENVAVAFLAGPPPAPEDAFALLGMSFLEHFRLTIEDAKNQIILTAK